MTRKDQRAFVWVVGKARRGWRDVHYRPKLASHASAGPDAASPTNTGSAPLPILWGAFSHHFFGRTRFWQR